MQQLQNIYALSDLERLARKRLPKSIFTYIAAGAGDGTMVAASRHAFDSYKLVPKVLTNVSERDKRVTLFGRPFDAPIGVAPMGIASLCHFDGDRALAKAAARQNLPYVLSGASTTPLEAVLKVNDATWFQAYLSSRWELTAPLLDRLSTSGVKTLVITVDVPVAAIREAERRAGFSVPLKVSPKLAMDALMHPRWLLGSLGRSLLKQGVPHFENIGAGRSGPVFSTSVDHRASRAEFTWDHIKQIREYWKGNLVLKGILRTEDALRAESIGVDGLIVSNHGGRQLGGCISPMEVLAQIVSAVPNLTVMVDGGVRQGVDVLKALALGAKCAFVGRPVMYGLACRGAMGASFALEVLQREIDIDMALAGCRDIKSMDRSFILNRAQPGAL